MTLQINAPSLLELVDEDSELEQLGTGFTFTEGPIWNPAGYLLFSDMPGDVHRRWDEEGGVREVANPSNKGNGMTLDAEGRLIVCEHVTSSVVRMHPGRNWLRPRDPRLPVPGQGAQQPQRRDRGRRRSDLLHRSDYGRMPGFGPHAIRSSTSRASTGSRRAAASPSC